MRQAYHIPELAYAVVSADTVFEVQTLGVQRVNTAFLARPADRFHIGSNTKAITSFLAAVLVEQGKITWDTPFLALFPELKSGSRACYRRITLQDLLTFRGKLPSYTYTFDQPTRAQITGNNAHQRLLLAKYFLAQKPMKEQNGLTPSNADYILAGLMLEKAACKTYKELVTACGSAYGIAFQFDYPNLTDPLQPWGHSPDAIPLPPADNYKLNWLLSAGNINVTLPDYIKFIQLQLNGLKGKAAILPQATFEKLLFGLPVFSFGWFNRVDAETRHHIAYNEGNAGAFTTQVQLIQEADRAYVIFTNSATSETAAGMAVLQAYLQARYGR